MPKMEGFEKMSEIMWMSLLERKGEPYIDLTENKRFLADAKKFVTFFKKEKDWQDNLPQGADLAFLLKSLKYLESVNNNFDENPDALLYIAYAELVCHAIEDKKKNIVADIQHYFPDLAK